MLLWELLLNSSSMAVRLHGLSSLLKVLAGIGYN